MFFKGYAHEIFDFGLLIVEKNADWAGVADFRRFIIFQNAEVTLTLIAKVISKVFHGSDVYLSRAMAASWVFSSLGSCSRI